MEKFQPWKISPETSARLVGETNQYRKNLDYIDENFSTLMKLHKGTWIAVVNETVAATNPDFRELFRTLDEANVDRASSVIRFLDPDPKPHIY